jgi:Predicted transcriptional regulators
MDALETSTRHGEICPLDTTLKILDGKWKSIILCRLMDNELRYSELLRSLSGCTRRMLSLQLSQLEHDQIIQKEIDTTFIPIKISYHLTELGKSLVPIIKSMDQWGELYIEAVSQNEK